MAFRKENTEEYAALCNGLERMADLYKHKKDNATGKKQNRAVYIFRKACRIGPRETIRRIHSRLAGIDSGVSPALAEAEEKSAVRDTYYSTERIAVYTAEFGGYDEVLEPVIQPDNIDYFLLTDREAKQEGYWKPINPQQFVPPEYLESPVLANRWCKMHPETLFPEYRYSIYIDSNFLIVSDFTVLINRMQDYPVAMFRHKNRDCVYDEVTACMIKKKAPREALERQRALLKAHGVPEKYGLLEAPVIVRRHHDPRCMELMDTWWQAFLEGSRRDQISLIDALWKLKIQPSEIGTLGPSINLCNLFIRMPHKKGVE